MDIQPNAPKWMRDARSLLIHFCADMWGVAPALVYLPSELWVDELHDAVWDGEVTA